MKSVTLVIARYNEDLYWILKLPEHIRVVVYNKGSEILEKQVRAKIDSIIPRKNIGRESETYLEHVRNSNGDFTEWTAFAQGDPFPHSPDFLKILEKTEQWNDIQPLTLKYLAEQDVPPAFLIRSDTREHLGDARVRSELFSLTTLQPLTFVDDGAEWIAKNYREGHSLPKYSNLVEHFFEVAGWDEMTRKAGEACLGRLAYGAMFAVRSSLMANIPADVLERLQVMARGHNAYGFIFERVWLHFFGLPFSKVNP
ncbi:MAG: hypothetical protein ABIS50_03615 [Luteolibacter sp.]|uniref:hypothetical protein n=1 Tax=Luteolibacter sp. TaxID=1962973 RepID=UPI003267EE76